MTSKQVTFHALAGELAKLGQKAPAAGRRALRAAARYGHTKVIETIRATVPPIRAGGTFERAWSVFPTNDGALLGNTSRHSTFVEVGRAAGKAPPPKVVREWLMQKGIVPRRGPGRKKLAQLAYLVGQAIARQGVAGRYPLKRTMPAIQAFALLRVKEELKKVGK